MTTTATEIQHTRWCNDHSGPTPDWPDATELCSWERHVVGNYHVNVEEGENGSPQPYVAVWGHGDPMTLQEAQEMAAATVEAISIAKGHDRTTTTVLRNLTEALAAKGSLPVDDLEPLANLLDIDVLDLVTDRW